MLVGLWDEETLDDELDLVMRLLWEEETEAEVAREEEGELDELAREEDDDDDNVLEIEAKLALDEVVLTDLDVDDDEAVSIIS